MDLFNDFFNQIMKNTTFEIKINIPMIPENKTPFRIYSNNSIFDPQSFNTLSNPTTLNTSTIPVTTTTQSPINPKIEIPETEPTTNIEMNIFKQLIENFFKSTNENDDILTLVNQIEQVIDSLKKIFISFKDTNNQFGIVDNYLEMLKNFEKILKSFKLIRTMNHV